jgi:hypothetical protein
MHQAKMSIRERKGELLFPESTKDEDACRQFLRVALSAVSFRVVACGALGVRIRIPGVWTGLPYRSN